MDVLVGEGGSTLRKIESRVEIWFDVGSENGSVVIDGAGNSALDMIASDMARVVGRGFAPGDAVVLLDDDMMTFELIGIDRYIRNKDDMRRQKGRLIGEDGRTRELMGELTGADVATYDATLGIIGQSEEVEVICRTVKMILDGAPHDAVYSLLKRKHNELTRGFNVRQSN